MWELSYDKNKDEFIHPYLGCISVNELLLTQVNFNFSYSFMTPSFINYRRILKREIGRPEAKRILYWLLENPFHFSSTSCRKGIPELIFFIYRAYPDMTKSVIEYVTSLSYRLRDSPVRLKTLLCPYGVPASCLLHETKDDRIFELYKRMFKMMTFDLLKPRFLYALLITYNSSSATSILLPRFHELMFDAFHYGVTPCEILYHDYILEESGLRLYVAPCKDLLYDTYYLFVVHKSKLTLFEIITRHFRIYKIPYIK
jgi:hypothetical protein